MPFAVTDRATQLIAALVARPQTYLIAIAGIPGAGKSTLCAELLVRLPRAAVLPMDGYHIPRNRLDAEGLSRRGAPHTFDDAALRHDLSALRHSRRGSFPAF